MRRSFSKLNISIMEEQISAQTYLEVADALQQDIDNITANTDKLFLPILGDLQRSLGLSPEAKVLQEQVGLLEERASEAIILLNILALLNDTREEDFAVHPLLKEQMRMQVQPFLKYYRKQPKKSEKEELE
jgi:hypothetical protein